MSDITTSPTEEKHVEVWCHSPDAHEVFLAGDFNHWDPKANPMTRVGGNWKVKVSVVPGMHNYNFVIDGKWVCDPNRMEPRETPCQLLIQHWLG